MLDFEINKFWEVIFMYEVDKYTVSLLHFDDGIKDETRKVWAGVGSPVVSSAQSKFGGESLYLDGASYLTTGASEDFNFGSGDFTIDWWEYRTANTNYSSVLTLDNPGNVLMAGYNASGAVHCYAYTSKMTTILNQFSLGSLDLNTWNHFVLVRHGNTFYGFKNGKLVSTSVNTLSLEESINITIGKYQTKEGGLYYFQGYIDELRVSKGIARWIGDFNPELTLTATAGDSKVTLSWTALDGATSYIVKRSTTSGGAYETIASGVTDINYVDTNVTNGTTYYYVVVAVTADGESNNSNEASATPVGDGKALLCVTMIDSSEREYQLSTAEIDAFINWFSRTVGTGTTCYVLNKNVGVHNRKEYLAFEKIISFEVTEI
ncbi:MAG: hypothetical protein K0Q53_1479 [Massilibacillus sp.]|jgi:hypothetical protein|nr:hypothetical protein [Massilibacillus sp.]